MTKDTHGSEALPTPNAKRLRPAAAKESTLGDLLPHQDGFSIPAYFTPEERVILTANGNLQRLISAYYNAPVTVKLIKNDRTGHGRYERLVSISVLDIEFATASSQVELEDEECIEAVEKKGIAIGQLFRHFEILPTFKLLDASREDTGAFERTYLLSGKGVSCTITEKFVAELFQLKVPTETADGPQSSAPPHFGDLMAANQTYTAVPMGGFTPMERILLTANGNVQRIVSSFYNTDVHVHVISNMKNSFGGYDRQISMTIAGHQFLVAKSTIHLVSEEYLKAVESGVPLGGLFQHMKVLPVFALHSVGKGAGYFWRVYTLKSGGMSCEIHETISDTIFDMQLSRSDVTPEHVYI